MILEDGLPLQPAAPRWLTPARICGLAILGVLTLMALLPMAFSPDPRVQDLSHVLTPPNAVHPLGTDQLGRDVLARVSAGIRLTCGLALLSVLTTALIGSAAGLVAALRGGWVDQTISLLADALLSIPPLLMIVIFIAFAPGHLLPIYMALALSLWVEYFRLVRATALQVMASPHVEASRVLGFNAFYIMRRHLWPEVAPYVASLMVMGTATAVLALAAVGFVGTGLRPPTAELGLLMSESFAFWRDAPWLLGAPVAALVAGVLGLALLTGAGAKR